MRITVTHSTVYRYDFPVYLEPHIFRLRPRTNGAQRLLAFDLQIAPTPAANRLSTLNSLVGESSRAFRARVPSVEMLRENPFDYVLTSESLNLPLCYLEPLGEALTHYRNDVNVVESVKQYAPSTAAGERWNILWLLTALSGQIFQTCRQVIRPFGPPWPSARALSSLKGSCRVMGIAARLVSGYECASASSQDSDMHAWADVCLPGIGWRGYDPSRGIAVSITHGAVAAGFDHDLASPVAGWYSGGSASRMEASLSLQVAHAA